MAKVIENEKGFKVIELSLSEVNKAFGGLGICDDCNKALGFSKDNSELLRRMADYLENYLGTDR